MDSSTSPSANKPGPDLKAIVTETLLASGWSLSTRGQMFEETSLEYANAQMALEVDFDEPDQCLYLGVYGEHGAGVHLAIYCQHDLRGLLDAIIAFQDAIAPDNYQGHIRNLLRVCPEVYVEIGDDYVPLVDE